MKTPREVAEQIMNDALKGGILNSPSIVDRIESAILAERERWRAFADEKGEPRKVLGTLPVLASGEFVGDGVELYLPAANPGQFPRVRSNKCQFLSRYCSSAAAAALAAAAKGVGK